MKSVTRYIAAVPLRIEKVEHSFYSGIVVQCDTPGFGDTVGGEVDIANAVGVINANKGCKSVILL